MIRWEDLLLLLGGSDPVEPGVDLEHQLEGLTLTPQMGAVNVVAAGVDAPPRMSADLVTFPARTHLATLDLVAAEFNDIAYGVGAARTTIDMIDPAVPMLQEGRLIEHRVDGQLVFTSIVEQWDLQRLAETEEVDQTCMISGRGHLAILEYGVVEPLIFGVGPTGTPTMDRVFNWAAPDFNDSSWLPATEIRRQGDMIDPAGTWTQSSEYPLGWPDEDAYWILTRPLGPGSPSEPKAPVGPTYFRHKFTLTERTELRVYVGADDEWEIWIDGVKHSSSAPAAPENWGRTQHVDMGLAAGEHTIGVKLVNSFRPSIATNAAGFIAAAYTISQRTKRPDQHVFSTDRSWLGLDFPATAPGFTPGEIIRIAVEEAQARGGLQMVSLSFTDRADSAGTPWPEVADFGTKAGTDLLTFIVGELGSTYVDVEMLPGGYLLDAYVKDTAWNTRNVDLRPALGGPSNGELRSLLERYG